MLEGQVWHVLFLATLLVTVGAASGFVDLGGTFLGLSAVAWLALALIIPIVHQAFVLVVWRLELHAGAVSRRFGRERGFDSYAAVFTLLALGRPIAVFGVAMANSGTLALPDSVAYAAAVALLVPFVYLQYSVARYFGFRRALGADHFDERYRNMPLVRDGIFRYTPNAMYVVGFFLLWIIALALKSQAALLAAAFNHAYIWVHFYCTEKPDMQRIYGS